MFHYMNEFYYKNTRHQTTDDNCWIGHRFDRVLVANFIINDPFVMLYFDAKNSTAKKYLRDKEKETKQKVQANRKIY